MCTELFEILMHTKRYQLKKALIRIWCFLVETHDYCDLVLEAQAREIHEKYNPNLLKNQIGSFKAWLHWQHNGKYFISDKIKANWNDLQIIFYGPQGNSNRMIKWKVTVNRYRRGLETCPQARTSKRRHAIFFSFFSDAPERRVWLSAESKILASTFGRSRLDRLRSIFLKIICHYSLMNYSILYEWW